MNSMKSLCSSYYMAPKLHRLPVFFPSFLPEKEVKQAAAVRGVKKTYNAQKKERVIIGKE